MSDVINIEQLILNNLLSEVSNSIISIDVHGIVNYWNNGAEKIFEYTKDEMIGKSLKFIYPNFDESLLLSHLNLISKEGSKTIEWCGVSKSGKTVWVDLSIKVFKSDNGDVIGFIWFSHDITEKKENSKYKAELQNIIDFSEDGIGNMDLEGNILSWNKGAEKIYGYSADEMIGKNAFQIYSNQFKDEFTDNLEIIRSGKPLKIFGTKQKNKSGEIININISFIPLRDAKEDIYGISVITRDLTGQKKAESDLKTSVLKYKAIFENSGEGFLLISDERFIECNKKLCEMWEYEKDEIIGNTLAFFSPKYQADGSLSDVKATKYIKKAFKDGSVSFYWQHLTKSGVVLEMRISLNKIIIGGIQQIIAVVQDLSELFKYQNKLELKTKELALQNTEVLKLNEDLNETNNRLKIINNQIEESERRFRIAFKTSPDAAAISRLDDGMFFEINKGFTTVLGYTDDDVRDKTPFEIRLWEKEDDRKRFYTELKESGGVSNFETAFRKKDGSFVTILISASLIDIKGVEHVISMSRDITERKEYERKLKKATKKAEESDMLKSTFLANMSHEIRTPMNAILGFSQLLKEKVLEREKQNKFLDIIVSRAKNLLQIINDIIDISKIEANQLKIESHEFSLKKTLYELHSFFEAEIFAHGRTELKLEFKSELNKLTNNIESDENRLKQILTNLISNSIKFTEQGTIEFGFKIKGDKLEFFVKDTGVGIPEESKKYIFERFRQVDDSSTRTFGGTGLGLSISKQLVEKLGGNIWFESEEGKGSTFYFTLPYNKIKKNSEELNSAADLPLDLSGKKVLIVEDDLISMTYLEELLKATNATIVKAIDGRKAVEAYKKESDIDIILMDVYLPLMSGNEATKVIKSINKKVPIIMQSAYAMAADKEKSFKCGCDDYITKPIDVRILMHTIKKHIG